LPGENLGRGNTASFLGKTLGVAIDQVGRVLVNNDLTIPGHPEVQVIGDLVTFLINGPAAPRCFACRHAAGSPCCAQHFKYDRRTQTAALLVLDKGSMATIGRNKAVADLNFVHFSGLPAWVVWLFVHVLFLVGFRNRFAVLFQWAWAYFTFNKGARLITRNFQSETRPQFERFMIKRRITESRWWKYRIRSMQVTGAWWMRRIATSESSRIVVRNLQRAVRLDVPSLQRFSEHALRECACIRRPQVTPLKRLREISVLLISDRRMRRCISGFSKRQDRPTSSLLNTAKYSSA